MSTVHITNQQKGRRSSAVGKNAPEMQGTAALTDSSATVTMGKIVQALWQPGWLFDAGWRIMA